MDIITVKTFANRCFDVAEIWKNDKKISTVNKFYEVTKDWIIIYETNGGCGYGYQKGNVIEKIYIGDSELKLERNNG